MCLIYPTILEIKIKKQAGGKANLIARAGAIASPPAPLSLQPALQPAGFGSP